jgi:hypothetical protein
VINLLGCHPQASMDVRCKSIARQHIPASSAIPPLSGQSAVSAKAFTQPGSSLADHFSRRVELGLKLLRRDPGEDR